MEGAKGLWGGGNQRAMKGKGETHSNGWLGGGKDKGYI